MAMQMKTIANKLLSPMANLVRNYSRVAIPIFWEDPFRYHRQFLKDIWNAADPFDVFAPVQRYMGYRMPSKNYYWENEKLTSNPKDGFHVSFNVEHFSPNEISVKVADNTILVEAKHEERAENGERYVSRHFLRRYVLPAEFNFKDIVSTLSSDGILTVRVPAKQIEPQNMRNIHIQQTGAPARSPAPIDDGPQQNRNQQMVENKNEPKEN